MSKPAKMEQLVNLMRKQVSMLQNHLRVRVVGAIVAGVSVFTAYHRMQPAPAAYIKFTVQREYEPKPVEDPKVELRFNNVGFGPIYVTQFQLFENGNKTTVEEAFKTSVTNLDTSSSSLFIKKFKLPRPWAYGHTSSTLVTVRPKNPKQHGWDDIVIQEIKKKKLSLRVTYSWTRNSWWPKQNYDIPLEN